MSDMKVFTYKELEKELSEYDFRITKNETQLVILDNVSNAIVGTIGRLEEGVLDTNFLYSLDNDKTTRGYLPYLYLSAPEV